MLSARAINEEMICSTSSTSGQTTLKKGHSAKSTTHFSGSEKQPTQSPKHTSCNRYISSQRKAYLHLNYLFRYKLKNAWVSKFAIEVAEIPYSCLCTC